VLAFSPDGQMLVMTGAGRTLTLWDLVANRARAAPELQKFSVRSIAMSPDGRTLAAGGMTVDEKGVLQQGQVRLYDLAREPVARRTVLTFDRDVRGGDKPDERVMTCSDVAFTPDGRVVAVGMHKIKTWDAATGGELDAFDRGGGSSSDRLAVSPDGRWLAITSPFGAGLSIVDIVPP
jgi:WD40 repeat protein